MMRNALNGQLSQHWNGQKLILILNACQILGSSLESYDWSGLRFPVSMKNIGMFETNINISVNPIPGCISQSYS